MQQLLWKNPDLQPRVSLEDLRELTLRESLRSCLLFHLSTSCLRGDGDGDDGDGDVSLHVT